jgi:hypothetical protein
MKKRCEGMLDRIGGAYEQCDNLAQHGSDFLLRVPAVGKQKGRSVERRSGHIQKGK